MALNILKRISDLKAYSSEIFFDNVQGLVKSSKHREFNNAIFDVLCPVGTIVMYAKPGENPAPPPGWLICNGQGVSKSTYVDLFNLIGYAYTEAGLPADTFRVPDFVYRFPLGYEPYGSNPGSKGGDFKHTLTVGQLPPHRHNILGITGGDDNNNSNTSRFAGGDKGTSESNFFFTNTTACEEVGSGQIINHMPPYIVTNFIIKV